jgi:hypothetical protein
MYPTVHTMLNLNICLSLTAGNDRMTMFSECEMRENMLSQWHTLCVLSNKISYIKN